LLVKNIKLKQNLTTLSLDIKKKVIQVSENLNDLHSFIISFLIP